MKVTLRLEFEIDDAAVQSEDQRDDVAARLRQWSRGCEESIEPMFDDKLNRLVLTDFQLDAPWPK